MKKVLCICLTAIIICTPVFSIDVNILELQSSGKIEFTNYPGRISDSVNFEDVRNIGRTLANDLNNDGNISSYLNKYSAKHFFDTNEPDKNGADIIIPNSNVIILHINWIRQVLTGFIQVKYNYSIEDSKLLATFVTYYNAVHRKDLPYFQNHYQVLASGNMNGNLVGLSTNYTEWAGNSEIIIPLTDKQQDIGALDTLLLTEDDVIEQLRQEDDMGIEERTEMVDLQERQIEQAKDDLEQDKQDLQTAQDDLQSKKDDLAQSQQDTEDKQEQVDKLQDQLANTDDEAEQKVLQDQISDLNQEIEDDKEDQAKQQQDIEDIEDDIEDKQEQVDREQDRISDMEQDVEQEKDDIERDQTIRDVQDDPEPFVDRLEDTEQELEDTKSTISKTEPVIENVLYYLKVKEYLTNGHYNNELFAIDTTTGEVLYSAPDSHICGHEYWATDEGILVITHVGSHKNHFLTLLDLGTLEPSVTGEENIFHRSFIYLRDDFIYAVTSKNNNSEYYLGKFDSSLNLVSESAEQIDPNTAFHLYGDLIYINSPDKEMLVLNKNDLTKQNIINLD
jgi:hypothetical protein